MTTERTNWFFRYMIDSQQKTHRVKLEDIPSRLDDGWVLRDREISMYKDSIQVKVKSSDVKQIQDFLKTGYAFGLTAENREKKREEIKPYTSSGYYKDRKYEPITTEGFKMEKKVIGRPRKQPAPQQLELPFLEQPQIVETKPIVETKSQNQIALGLFNTLLSKGVIKTFEISLNKNGNISFIGECETK
jgi:hypothetical protein